MNNEWFITKIKNLLPSGFEAKKFNNMPRIHIKYDNYGFAVIDMNQNNYNLFAIEGLFSAIGVKDFELISNMSRRSNLYRKRTAGTPYFIGFVVFFYVAWYDNSTTMVRQSPQIVEKSHI